MQLRQQTLSDKYTLEEGAVFCNGLQAIVRLLLTQRRLDAKNGWSTAAFVSGYRGSPLGGLDQQLWQARKFLKAEGIVFNPGLNEDLAATSVWGTQQLNFFEGADYEGVLGLWYGKGPGVDRSGDALKHANHAGTMPKGGVLMLVGDDHAAKSSSLPHQSDLTLMSAGIPILAPSTVQEVLDFGLLGYGMSRYSGCWVSMKLVSDTIEAASTIKIGLNAAESALPADFEIPKEGVHIRWPDTPAAQEKRLYEVKLPAAQAFAQANGLDKWVAGAPTQPARLGIVTSGKSYHDVLQALRLFGLGLVDLEAAGVRLLKVGLVWPLDQKVIRAFAQGVEEILVVEEKRPLLEDQVKTNLYGLGAGKTPKLSGKQTPEGQGLLSPVFELSVADIARALLNRFNALKIKLPEAPKCLEAEADQGLEAIAGRLPFYCSGCPHNTSTRQLPEGSRALAGIGCHYMAMWITDFTQTSTHMGAEGMTWVGAAPFVKENHVFVNMGDGTYYHSGSLAIRAAVAAGVNATYKILFNDAVAMTGGQPVDGPLTVSAITRQVAAEGVAAIAVVTDAPNKYPIGANFAPGVVVYHREKLAQVQESFKETPGVTVIVYDQTCAAEKRRRRKRGLMEDPPKRVMINEAVCEGCGDCGKASNCVSIQPLETEFGTKRFIDQTSCNKDYSCVKGFCPSFVTIEGTYTGSQGDDDSALAWIQSAAQALPTPPVAPEDHKARVLLIAGVGGTGMVTLGALVGMAAHLEGKACTIMDQTGLAQKGGAVFSHVKLAARQELLHAHKVAPGEADLLLGCDGLVAGSPQACAAIDPGKTCVVVNTHQTAHSDFTKNRDTTFPYEAIVANLQKASGGQQITFIDGEKLVVKALGSSQYVNLFMLGMAYQQGALGLSMESMLAVIKLNGVAVGQNTAAFHLGRLAVQDRKAVDAALGMTDSMEGFQALTALDDITAHRHRHLVDYQNRQYAQTYTNGVLKIQVAEQAIGGGELLSKLVAKNYHKLLAYKDEYEVARLYTQGDFRKKLAAQFAPGYRITFHLAPPLLPTSGPVDRPDKRTFGPWMWRVFQVLAKFKGLRGTWADIFGYTKERRQERALIGRYEALIELVATTLTKENQALAIPLLAWPERIKGFGPVKEKSIHETMRALDEAEAVYNQRLSP